MNDAQAENENGVLKVMCEAGQDADVLTAKAVLSPGLASATVAGQWTQRFGGSNNLNLMATIKALESSAALVNSGDLSEVEARLLAQATALDALFAELSRRAAKNINEYPDAFDRYLKLALKAQNQSRMTLETLASVKNPPVVYAKQANITTGPQQVNNNVALPAHTQENKNPPNKLLEQSIEQRMDTGTQGQTVSSNPAVATLEPVKRAQVG